MESSSSTSFNVCSQKLYLLRYVTFLQITKQLNHVRLHLKPLLQRLLDCVSRNSEVVDCGGRSKYRVNDVL